ncbi:hypothetical protein F4X86_03655 [Candidatus Saccharibacteria bacterium]|nr:hypothetical protein [Candidatus Saccharibacteria bacterium]
MPNFFKRNQDDYDNFQGGVLSEELKASINGENRKLPMKSFLLHFSRFIAIFIIIFSIALTGFWLWRENTTTTTETPVLEVIEESGAANQVTAGNAAAAAGGQTDGGNTQAAAATDIVDTSASLAGITAWTAVGALIVFAFVAATGHRLVHNLLGA